MYILRQRSFYFGKILNKITNVHYMSTNSEIYHSTVRKKYRALKTHYAL